MWLLKFSNLRGLRMVSVNMLRITFPWGLRIKGRGKGEGRKRPQKNPWILKTEQGSWLTGIVEDYWHMSIKELKVLKCSKVVYKRLKVFSQNEDWLTKFCHKTALHRRRCKCVLETWRLWIWDVLRFSLTRSSCFALLWNSTKKNPAVQCRRFGISKPAH